MWTATCVTTPDSCEPTEIVACVLDSVDGSTKPVPATVLPKGLLDGVTGGGTMGSVRCDFKACTMAKEKSPKASKGTSNFRSRFKVFMDAPSFRLWLPDRPPT